MLIGVISFVFGLSQEMLRPLIALYAASLGAGPFLVGVAVALVWMPGFLFAMPLGALVDALGPRRLVVGGYALFAVGATILTVMANLAGVLIGQFVIGTGAVCVALGVQTFAALPVGESTLDRARVTVFSTCVLLGHIIGPMLGGFLVDAANYAAVFGVVVAAALLAVLISLSLPASRPSAESQPSSTDEGSERSRRRSRGWAWLVAPYQGVDSLLRGGGMRLAVIASAVAVALSNLRTSFMPLHLTGLDWSTSVIGSVLAATAAAGMVSRGLHPLIERYVPVWLSVGCAVTVGALAVATALLTGSPYVIVGAMCLSGFMLSATNPLTLTLLARSISPARRGLGIGLRVTANRFGAWVGPMLVGSLAWATNTRAALLTISSTSAVTGIAAWRLRNRLPDDS